MPRKHIKPYTLDKKYKVLCLFHPLVYGGHNTAHTIMSYDNYDLATHCAWILECNHAVVGKAWVEG